MPSKKLNFIFTCDNAELRNGKLYVGGIFDSINAEKYPVIHKVMVLVSNFDVDQGEQYSEYFRIVRDKKVVITNQEKPVELIAPSPRHQFIHRIFDLKIEELGRYDVEIYINNELAAKTYFEAKIIERGQRYV